MIFTVAEFRALQEIVDMALSSDVPILKSEIAAAESALLKVHANTDWSTDPAIDVHKEPKPCQK